MDPTLRQKKKERIFFENPPPKKPKPNSEPFHNNYGTRKCFVCWFVFFGSRNGNSHGRVRCVGRGRATLIGCPSRPPEELFLRIYFVFFVCFRGFGASADGDRSIGGGGGGGGGDGSSKVQFGRLVPFCEDAASIIDGVQ